MSNIVFTKVCILVLAGHICLRAGSAQIFTPEICQQITACYENDPKAFSAEQLMPVAISDGILKRSDKATPLLIRYLQVKPNDAGALRMLGAIYVMGTNFDEGTKLLRKSWSLGDIDSLKILADNCLRTGKFKEMESLIQDMLQQRIKDPELPDMLVAYSMLVAPPNLELFKKVVGTMDDPEILQHRMVMGYILAGLEKVGETARATALRAKLKHWPDDDIDPNELTPERRKKTIQDYEKDPKALSDHDLLKVAICYTWEKKFETAEPLYKRFLTNEPDHARALRGLGIVLFSQERFQEAISPLKQAWDFADLDALSPLAASYLLTDKLPEFRELLPSLFKHKASNLELVNLLISYSLKVDPPDKDVFRKAIEGVTDEVILSRADTTQLAINGLEKFGFDARARALKKRATELHRANGYPKPL